MEQSKISTSFNDILNQDGGIVKSMYQTAVAMSSLTAADPEVSEETKESVYNLRQILDVLYCIHQSNVSGEEAPIFKDTE